ncbi:MAG: hypothetical protein RR365_15290, partial [Bacteroides sp.]
SLLLYQSRQLDECYDYLENEMGRETTIARFGMNDLILSPESEEESAYFSRPASDVDIEGYNQYLSNCRIHIADKNRMEVWCNDRLLLQADTKAHFEEYKEEMALWDRKAKNLEPFCF